ncbi:MAG: heme-binding domain-containing protein [Saprospiraceae bacterium]
MFKKIMWVFISLFLLIQIIRPNQKNPAVDPTVDFVNVAKPPTEVFTILKNACYNCHSFESKYPWYAQIAPVSWWISNHIEAGRENLNFSTFGNLPPGEGAEVLGECAEAVQEGEMPLSSYTWLGLHPGANLSESQRNLLVQWLNANGGEGGKSEGNDDDD